MVPTSPGVALRLLFVDDDEGIQQLMLAVFNRRKDVVAECVGDGDAALNRLRTTPYDVVVLDLMLPGANGFEVIRELKNRAPELLPRTIVLTAVAQAALRDFDDARLVRRVMRKPFELDDLVGEVLACGGRAATAEAH